MSKPQLLEEGAAFTELHGQAAARERFDVIVIGAGQAGLSVGYYLRRQGLRFVIVDGNERIGDSWRKRWDSLRLFTPAHLDGLVGCASRHLPTRSRPRTRWPITWSPTPPIFSCRCAPASRWIGCRQENGRYVVRAGACSWRPTRWWWRWPATSSPRLPGFAGELRPDIVQLHSSAYRHPAQLRPGPVLLAGAGNSGRRSRWSWPASTTSGCRAPPPGISLPHREFHRPQAAGAAGAARAVPSGDDHQHADGRKLRPKLLKHGGPLIRQRPKQLLAAGVKRVPRTVGVQAGCRCWKTAARWRWPTSSGAPGFTRGFPGLICRCSARTAGRCTRAAWSRSSRGCTSWG